MARTLQNSRFGITVLKMVSVMMVTTMIPSCVIAPAIEAEPQKPNRPPFLDFFAPQDPLITVNDDASIDLSVRAFDENPHENLFFVWVSEQTGAFEGVAPRELGDELPEGELFFRFAPIERTFSPCDNIEGEQRTTIWVYVADARLQLQGRNVSLEDPDEGFVTSHSWILEFEPDACF